MSAKNKRAGLLSAKFLLGLVLLLVSAIAGGMADVADVPQAITLGLTLTIRLLAALLFAMGGREVARQRGYSAFAGIVCGLTWPIGIMVLLCLDDRSVKKQS